MEYSLHRQLKAHYALDRARQEVKLGKYRIDVVDQGRLIEIQHGSLAAIRRKVQALLHDHSVLVVKPIVQRKRIVKHARRGGRVLHSRWSPKRGQPLDLFDQLVYFTRVFPHRRLVLEVPLVEIEEHRVPGHGRRRRWRTSDFQIQDQLLLQVAQVWRFHQASDLWQLLPCQLPEPFHTGQLAEALGTSRCVAQQIAYCLRQTGAARQVGKQGNAWLYQPARPAA